MAALLSGQQWEYPVAEHVLTATISRSHSPKCTAHWLTSLFIYCPFGGSGRCLLTLWGTSPLDFLSAMMARSVVTCVLGSDVPSCAELCSLCPQETCRFPTSWFLGLVSCVSSSQAFVFSSELVSLAQKELPLKLILQCRFGSGRKRICRFHVCAHAAGAPVFYSGKLV